MQQLSQLASAIYIYIYIVSWLRRSISPLCKHFKWLFLQVFFCCCFEMEVVSDSDRKLTRVFVQHLCNELHSYEKVIERHFGQHRGFDQGRVKNSVASNSKLLLCGHISQLSYYAAQSLCNSEVFPPFLNVAMNCSYKPAHKKT